MKLKLFERIVSIALAAAGFFLALGFVLETTRVSWLKPRPLLLLLGVALWALFVRFARPMAAAVNRSSVMLVRGAFEALAGGGSWVAVLAVAGLPVYAYLVTAIYHALDLIVPLDRLRPAALALSGAFAAQHLHAAVAWARSEGAEGARVTRLLAWSAVVSLNALSLGWFMGVWVDSFSLWDMIRKAALLLRLVG